jgi:hypothetical protein
MALRVSGLILVSTPHRHFPQENCQGERYHAQDSETKDPNKKGKDIKRIMGSKKQTGRTTRMLTEAATYAKIHGKAYVIANYHQKRQILDMLNDIVGVEHYSNYEIKLKERGIIYLVLPKSAIIHWRAGTIVLSGLQPPDDGVFADHYAIEQELEWALKEYTKYDL